MGQDADQKGQNVNTKGPKEQRLNGRNEDFVLEKNIFNNVFEKDIRRIFIYKKAERLAKALHLITPAFADSKTLKDKIDTIALSLVDTAVLPPQVAKIPLSRELLSLSSILSIARSSGLLSHMNAEIISREAHGLLHEIAGYEEPRLFLEEAPTLSTIEKDARKNQTVLVKKITPKIAASLPSARTSSTEKQKDNSQKRQNMSDRKDAVLSVIKDKGRVSIKDISTLIRGVSEKTIQRELLALVSSGQVKKEGERRWSIYSLAA